MTLCEILIAVARAGFSPDPRLRSWEADHLAVFTIHHSRTSLRIGSGFIIEHGTMGWVVELHILDENSPIILSSPEEIETRLSKFSPGREKVYDDLGELARGIWGTDQLPLGDFEGDEK